MMTTETEEREFFSLRARYNIAADASPNALLDDACLLLGCLEELMCTLAEGMSNKDSDMAANPSSVGTLLYGAQYSVKMIKGAVDAANSKLLHQRERTA